MKNRPLIWMLIALSLIIGLSACFFPGWRGDDHHGGGDHHEEGHN